MGDRKDETSDKGLFSSLAGYGAAAAGHNHHPSPGAYPPQGYPPQPYPPAPYPPAGYPPHGGHPPAQTGYPPQGGYPPAGYSTPGGFPAPSHHGAYPPGGYPAPLGHHHPASSGHQYPAPAGHQHPAPAGHHHPAPGMGASTGLLAGGAALAAAAMGTHRLSHGGFGHGICSVVGNSSGASSSAVSMACLEGAGNDSSSKFQICMFRELQLLLPVLS